MAKLPVELRVTRTPMAGGASTELLEALWRQRRAVLSCSVTDTQTHADQEANLVLDNTGGRFDAWESGDVVKIEARAGNSAAWSVLLEGVMGEPVDEYRGARDLLNIQVLGMSAILEMVKLTEERSYEDIEWTRVAEYLASDLGFQPEVTVDASFARQLAFPPGSKVRSAFDTVRRALIAATGSAWEHRLKRGAAAVAPATLGDARAWWKFDEAIGAATYADSVNANTLTPMGGAELKRSPRKKGNYLALNGETGYATAPDSISLSPTAALTVEAWVRLRGYFDPTSAPAIICSKKESWNLRINESGALEFVRYAGAGPSFVSLVIGATALPLDAWVHVAATLQGNGDVKVFINGVEDGSDTAAALPDSAGAFEVGRDDTAVPAQTAPYGFFPGDIDDLTIYGEALTAAELKQRVQSEWIYNLYKRDAASVGTVTLNDLLPGARRSRGSVFEVANDVQVLGADVPVGWMDHTFGTSHRKNAKYQHLNATTRRLAPTFEARGTWLHSLRLWANRTEDTDPDNVDLWLARMSDNLDKAKEHLNRSNNSIGRGFNYIRTSDTINLLNFNNMCDDDLATNGTFQAGNDQVEHEVIAFDFHKAGVNAANRVVPVTEEAWGFILKWARSTTQSITLKVQWSDNDADWTTALEKTKATTALETSVDFFAAAQSHRYWRLVVSTGAGESTTTTTVYHAAIIRYKNVATGATDPHLAFDGSDTTATTNTSTGGSVFVELVRIDTRNLFPWVKYLIRHNVSAANASIKFALQRSKDGLVWEDVIAIEESTTSTLDTIFAYDKVVGDGTWRHVRFGLRDDRAGGSASITSRCFNFEPHAQLSGDGLGDSGGRWYVPFDFRHSANHQAPLAGEQTTKFPGTSKSLTVGHLLSPPGECSAITWDAESVPLIKGKTYCFILQPVGTPSATKFWEFWRASKGRNKALLAIDDSFSARLSTDSGATWVTDDRLRLRVEFQKEQVQGRAISAASQTKYEPLVPAGVIAASHVDDAIQSNDVAEGEAKAITTRKSDTVERLVLPLKGDGKYVPGKSLALNAAVKSRYRAKASAYDIVDVRHELDGRGWESVVTLGEYAHDASVVAERIGRVSEGSAAVVVRRGLRRM